MNWTTRFLMVCLTVLVGIIAYGAVRFASIVLEGGIPDVRPPVDAHSIAKISFSTMTPPPFDENEDNEADGFGQIRGTVTAVNGNWVTINGQTYKLIPRHSDVMGYFQVGSDVRVEYSFNSDGSLTIEELKVLNGNLNSLGYSTPSSNYYYNDDDNDGD